MGYCTSYELDIDCGFTQKIRETLEKCDGASYALMLDVGDTRQATKWYDHERDMRLVSRTFPDALFTLKGEGEEGGDIWIKYFKAGECQVCRAKITFDPFDENKLS